MQARNGGFDDRFCLLLAPFEQCRHHHLGESSHTLVRFDDLHEITDSVAHVLNQVTMTRFFAVANLAFLKHVTGGGHART